MPEYYNIAFFSVIAFVLACVILGLSYILSIFQPSTEKVSVYECGFDAYEDARNAFEVRFYLLGIFFIVFDLEIAYLIPWSLSVSVLHSSGTLCILEFFLELCVGYIYIWKIGGLDWE